MSDMINIDTPFLRQPISLRLYKSAFSYYRRGYVKSLRQSGASTEILVQGTRNHNIYQVQIRAEEDGSIQMSCDCPTADQPCKHTLAAIIALSDRKRFGRHQSRAFDPIFFFINLYRRYKKTI